MIINLFLSNKQVIILESKKRELIFMGGKPTIIIGKETMVL